MRPARRPACAAKAGSAPQFIVRGDPTVGSSYPLSWLKHASSGVACMLSASFKTTCVVLLALQDLRSVPVDWVVVRPGMFGYG